MDLGGPITILEGFEYVPSTQKEFYKNVQSLPDLGDLREPKES